MCKWGLCSMQGWRCGMEDDHIAQEVTQVDGTKAMLFCVFDGHGGKEVAIYARDRFHKILVELQEFKVKNYKDALIETFRLLDEEIKNKEYGLDTGSTSNVVYFNDSDIYCANAGDSRSVLFTNDRVVALSEDHKPDNQSELLRIQKTDHFVEDSRVDGNLALSRAFGDFQYKDSAKSGWKDQAVSANPDVTITKRKKGDKFIILACDGIWDCLSNEECCKKVNDYEAQFKTDTRISKSKPSTGSNSVSRIVEEIFEEIIAPNTEDGIGTDNMTCILVYLNQE